jgi:hypothetical protein
MEAVSQSEEVGFFTCHAGLDPASGSVTICVRSKKGLSLHLHFYEKSQTVPVWQKKCENVKNATCSGFKRNSSFHLSRI